MYKTSVEVLQAFVQMSNFFANLLNNISARVFVHLVLFFLVKIQL